MTEDDPWERALARELTEAAEAAEAAAGREPLGIRAIEPLDGRRWYLAAFAGPAFLCLDRALTAERDGRRVRAAASASLLVEAVEALLPPDELRYFSEAGARLIAQSAGSPHLDEALQATGQAILALLAWREDPQREVASVAAVDTAVALQERAFDAYGRYVAVSEPLVSRQDELAPDLVSALRVYEEAAGRAGVAEKLASRLADAMADCEEGAEQVAAAHLVPLD